LLQAGFVFAYAAIVPLATRVAYAASCRRASIVAIGALAHSVWIVSAIQSIVAPAPTAEAPIAIGIAMAIGGHVLTIWAMRSNPHFLATVTIPERVVADGAYKYLRHPAYLGMALHSVGLVFLLGQSWALLPMTIHLALLARRCVIEDRILSRRRRPLKLDSLRKEQYRQVAEWEYGPQSADADWDRYIAEMSAPKWKHFAIYSFGEFVGCLTLEDISSTTAAYHVVTARRRVHPAALANILLRSAEVMFRHGFTKLVANIPKEKRAAVRLAIRCGMREEGADESFRHFVFTREDLYGSRKTESSSDPIQAGTKPEKHLRANLDRRHAGGEGAP
jgi:protein-S-isoprenylcysteine O-methyltransferase Ste14